MNLALLAVVVALAQTTPPAPGAPSSPAAPAVPKAPGAPTAPTAPTAPKPPSVPTAPAMPSMGEPLPNMLSPQERLNGWVLLFDGAKASTHFRGYRKSELPDGWIVQNGTLVRNGPGGDIVTREQYKDFEFVCDWKVGAGGNSGIMWHVSEELNNPWETGPEMQILDDAAHVDGRTPETSAGACYALYPAPEGAVKPAGQWNRARILVQGTNVQLWLNDVQTASFDTASDDWKQRIANSKFKDMPHFATKDRGFITLQDHGDEVAFRNIKIRPIK